MKKYTLTLILFLFALAGIAQPALISDDITAKYRLKIPFGISFPNGCKEGHLFNLTATADSGLYVYRPWGWLKVGSNSMLNGQGISKVLAGFGLVVVNDSTLRVDTIAIVSKSAYNAHRDSVNTALNSKLNIFDTSGFAKRTELQSKVTLGGDNITGFMTIGNLNPTQNDVLALYGSATNLLTLSKIGNHTYANFRVGNANWTSHVLATHFGKSDNIGWRFPNNVEGGISANLILSNISRLFINANSVGVGTISPNANASLELAETNKYFLPNRISTVQRDLLVSPVQGAIIYNTTDSLLQFYRDSWESLLTQKQGWMQGGNQAEVPIIGTVNNRSLRFISNNTQRLYLDSAVSRLTIGNNSGTSDLRVRSISSHENSASITLSNGNIHYGAGQSGGGGSHTFGGSAGVLSANVRLSVNARHRNNHNPLTNNYKSISNTSDVDLFTLQYDSIFGYYYKPGINTNKANVKYHASFVSEKGFVGINTLNPDPTTAIDIQVDQNNPGGIGLPTMTTSMRLSYTPTKTQVVFDTDLNKICLYITGVGWLAVTTESL